MFTKKNFEQVAEVLANAAPTDSSNEAAHEQFFKIVDSMVALFENDNAKFDKEKFFSHLAKNLPKGVTLL